MWKSFYWVGMHKQLSRLFMPHEAMKLTKLCHEVYTKVPRWTTEEGVPLFPSEMSWAEVRALTKEIIGEDGFKLLMAESKPPKLETPEEVAEFLTTETRYLAWWHNLKE